ncbi:MAG: Na+/H+ antiporter subunit E [Chlorobi bacterium]|nr:Na+/H+ antiporter subunit E [Chlorobiota bacterium]
METGVSKFNKFFYTWLMLFVVWLGFTTSFVPSEIITGVFLSFTIAVFSYKSFTQAGLKSLSPQRLVLMVKYFFVFVRALVKANLDVAKIVINPKLPINPGIVEFESKLTSSFARMILANSITLTPGTLTVDIIDNKFFIHWLYVTGTDQETVYKEIAKQFEDILVKIYN